MSAVLEVKNIEKTYMLGQVPVDALKGVSFSVDSGELVATRIDKPLTWWKTHLSATLHSSMARLWLWVLAFFVIVFWSTVGIQIFGLPLETLSISVIVGILSIIMVTTIRISAIVALVFDSHVSI